MKLVGNNKLRSLAILSALLVSFGFFFASDSGGDRYKHPAYTKIYSDLSEITYPVISPNGKFIVFTKIESSNHANLFIIPSDGSKSPERITSGNYLDSDPRWSPRGDKIAFSSSRSSDDGDIYTLEVSQVSGIAANELKRITLAGGRCPEWSPDARHILYINDKKDIYNFEFTLIPSNGGLPKTIYSTIRRWRMFWKFSPDGKYIYFCKNNDKGNYSIFRISSGGGEAIQLYENKTIIDISPKGDFLVMSDHNIENPDRRGYYLIGSTTGKGALQKFPVLKNMQITAWGNNENSLIASSIEDRSNVRIISSYGGQYRDLCDIKGEYPLVWSPNGKVIAFITDLNGSPSLMLVPASGGAARQIPTKKNLNAISNLEWSPNGKMLATRTINNKEILVIDLESNKEYSLSTQAVTAYNYTWSSDSKSIYYQDFQSFWNSKNSIINVGLDGKVKTIVPPKPWQRFATYQPVGQDNIYILRHTESRDSSFLISRSVRSNQEKVILRLKGYVAEISLSPNGKLVAFIWAQSIKSLESGIYLMSLDELKPIIISPEMRLAAMKWDLSGSRIFFIKIDEGESTELNSISVVDRQISTLTGSDPSSISNYDVSPDASQIVYSADASKNSTVWQLDISEILKDYKSKQKK
jgi:Tol biopolymer transport system component